VQRRLVERLDWAITDYARCLLKSCTDRSCGVHSSLRGAGPRRASAGDNTSHPPLSEEKREGGSGGPNIKIKFDRVTLTRASWSRRERKSGASLELS